MLGRRLTRREFVASTAVASAALVSAPYVRSAHAAGKLTIGFWDHWVPGANKTSTDLVSEWAQKEKLEVSIDYITSQGNKLLLTQTAEAEAKSGHDILASGGPWQPHAFAELLEPMNDIMEPIIQQNGEVNGTVKYLGQAGGKWLVMYSMETSTFSFWAHSLTRSVEVLLAPGTQWSQKPMVNLPAACAERT
jgi:ABC-type glycerol-3-phosphate transport system substrate-binding protein